VGVVTAVVLFQVARNYSRSIDALEVVANAPSDLIAVG
jgi:hypothetical protein